MNHERLNKKEMLNMYFSLIMLVGIVLAVLSVISLVKNFLINFNVSDNGFKTISIVLLIAVCLISAAIGYSEAYTIGDIKNMLTTPNLRPEEIQQFKELIPIKTMTVNVSILIGCIAYFLHLLLLKNVKQDKLKQMESGANGRWKY